MALSIKDASGVALLILVSVQTEISQQLTDCHETLMAPSGGGGF